MLLDRGASVKVGPNFPPLLPLAASIGSEGVMSLLLKHPELQINEADEHGFTALMNAAEAGNPIMVQMLLDASK